MYCLNAVMHINNEDPELITLLLQLHSCIVAVAELGWRLGFNNDDTNQDRCVHPPHRIWRASFR